MPAFKLNAGTRKLFPGYGIDMMTLRFFFGALCLFIANSPFFNAESSDSKKMISDYKKARKYSLFGNEYRISLTETNTLTENNQRSRFKRQTIKYWEKSPFKKVEFTILETSAASSDDVGKGTVGVFNDTILVMSEKFPNDKGYYPVRVWNDRKEASESFGSVKPIFCPYIVDEYDVLDIFEKAGTEIKNVKETIEENRHYVELEWSDELSSPEGPYVRSGTMKFDKDNHWALVHTRYSIGPVGQPITRSESTKVEYGVFGERRLPTKLTYRLQDPIGDSWWKEFEYKDIEYSFEKIPDSEFDLSKIGYTTTPSNKPFRLGIYAVLFGVVLIAFVFVRKVLAK